MPKRNIGPNWKNRTIWTRDNLEVLRGMNSDCVDLIYLDPPFNSNKNYAAPIGSKAAGAFFKDIWTWDDVKAIEVARLEAEQPILYQVIQAARSAHTEKLAVYLLCMAPRLVEMRRILKPTGSIYLHCDPTASHYLKMVMDVVFGHGMFRNEIPWCYPPGGKAPKRAYHKKHDIILYYGDKEGVWNPPYTEMSACTLNSYSKVDKDGRRYKCHGVGGGKRVYLDEQKGRPVPDWWTDIASFGTATNSSERCGYPTQKPLALLRRIISASSNYGDTVLDPFCGCATACLAAQDLGREWVGIDISAKAYELVQTRMHDELGFFAEVYNSTDVPKRTDGTDKAPPGFTPSDFKPLLYVKQNGICPGCQEHFERRNMTVDHKTAKAKGGTDRLENLWLLCQACNSKKGTKSVAEFMEIMAANGYHKRTDLGLKEVKGKRKRRKT